MKDLYHFILHFRTKTDDPEKEKMKAKAKEIQRIEQETIRHQEANRTALEAIGGPKKRKFGEVGGGGGGGVGGGGGAGDRVRIEVAGRLLTHPWACRVRLYLLGPAEVRQPSFLVEALEVGPGRVPVLIIPHQVVEQLADPHPAVLIEDQRAIRLHLRVWVLPLELASLDVLPLWGHCLKTFGQRSVHQLVRLLTCLTVEVLGHLHHQGARPFSPERVDHGGLGAVARSSVYRGQPAHDLLTRLRAGVRVCGVLVGPGCHG